MKKLFGLLLIAIIALSSCADSKTFERADGTKFVAEPYGWANYQTKKIEGVTYEACIGNIVWDVMIMCEQLSNYFGKEKVELEKERKLERLKERLSKYTD